MLPLSDSNEQDQSNALYKLISQDTKRRKDWPHPERTNKPTSADHGDDIMKPHISQPFPAPHLISESLNNHYHVFLRASLLFR